jgi:hypothetical protein
MFHQARAFKRLKNDIATIDEYTAFGKNLVLQSMADFVVVGFVARHDTLHLLFTRGYNVSSRYMPHAAEYEKSHVVEMYRRIVSYFWFIDSCSLCYTHYASLYSSRVIRHAKSH